LTDPRSVVPESIMPPYAHLAEHELAIPNIADHLKTLKIVGVPYTQEEIDNAAADLAAQANPDADTAGLLARYPKAVTGDFDGNPAKLTEMDALVSYLQVLGRMVDFTTYRPEYANGKPEGETQ
jgi:cytochrome c oxidase cbb3-type subunit 2